MEKRDSPPGFGTQGCELMQRLRPEAGQLPLGRGKALRGGLSVGSDHVENCKQHRLHPVGVLGATGGRC